MYSLNDVRKYGHGISDLMYNQMGLHIPNSLHGKVGLAYLMYNPQLNGFKIERIPIYNKNKKEVGQISVIYNKDAGFGFVAQAQGYTRHARRKLKKLNEPLKLWHGSIEGYRNRLVGYEVGLPSLDQDTKNPDEKSITHCVRMFRGNALGDIKSSLEWVLQERNLRI